MVLGNTVGRIVLKNDEPLEVLRVQAPCGEWSARIVNFMYLRHPEYTNCTWHRNCERVVTGEFEAVSRDVFFLGLMDGEIVATTWYGTPAETGDVGTFGRVITAREHRLKGIATGLCQAALDDFTRLDGWVMHLGTGLEGHAHGIYRSIGYRDYNYLVGNGTVMRAVVRGDYDEFEAEYFAAGRAVSLQPLSWGDLARAELLYNLPHWFLKDYSLRIYANSPFEGQFFDLMTGVERGEPGLALMTDAGRLVGLAYSGRTGAGGGAQDHVRVLECLVHPNYAEEGARLVSAVADRIAAGKVLAYASALDVQKCEALQEAGFEREAVLAEALQDAGSEFDLYVYSRGK